MTKPATDGEARGLDMKLPKITAGHALKDITCPHGSRFYWTDSGGWTCALAKPDCDCPDPPVPERLPCLGCGAAHVAQCTCDPDPLSEIGQ